MRQIAEWLAKSGLERYTPAFIDNDIDVEVLRYLTDADLEKIGVSLGHRRKLLAAIAELGGGPATTAQPHSEPNKQETAERREPTPTTVAPPPPSASAEVAGERRYLTVMFCDLVDSTRIAARLDAEEWRDVVNAYLDDASAAVTEMGGHVAKKLGDGLMALFGYPLAHENDAERAARAALSIQRALADLNRKNAGIGKPELKTRIGLETGPVVVDATGEVYGDAPNTAARVQALAEPGAVLTTAQVQRQAAGLFIERPLAGAAPGHSSAAGTRADRGAGRVAPPAIGGTDGCGDGQCAGSAGGAGRRGSALGRSDSAGCAGRHCRARRAGAVVHRGDDPA